MSNLGVGGQGNVSTDGRSATLGRRLLTRLSPDSWMALGLFILLALISALSFYQQTQNQAHPPLTSFSTQPDGARAFWLWLEGIGYEVSDRVTATFAIPEGTDVMLLLEPTIFIEPVEWSLIDGWVENGGTLVVVGSGIQADQAFAHFDFGLNLRIVPSSDLLPQNPLMAAPPPSAVQLTDEVWTLQTRRDDFVTHFALGGAPVVVSLEQGNGRVILTTFALSFTNKGLQTAGYSSVALNLIRAAGQAQKVWFDEWHHGVRVQTNEIADLGTWLRRTPLGRAFVFIAVVVFAALVLQGRPFGRPVPLPQDTNRRAPIEYITALANLSRRAGHRTAVLQDYHHRLKKNIGHRYRLNPTLPDAEFLARLAEYNPHLDQAALGNLLHRLSATNVNEGEMVQLAAEVSDWLNH